VAKGYHGTNLSDIAAECGMGRTSLYQYFKNKEEIFFFAIRKEFEKLKRECNRIARLRALSSLDKIKKIIGTAVENYERNNMMVIFSELWLLLKMTNHKVEEHLHQDLLQIRQIFNQLIREAIDAGEMKETDDEAMSSVLFALVESLFLEKTWNKKMKSEEHLQAVYLLIDGLRG
jgi:AcrR family transcriptional regulator